MASGSHPIHSSQPLLNSSVTRSTTLPMLKVPQPVKDLRRSITSMTRKTHPGLTSPSESLLGRFTSAVTPPQTPASRSSSALQIAYHQSLHTVTLAQEVPKVAEVPAHLRETVKENIHRASIGSVTEALLTNLEIGLTTSEALQRSQIYGSNVLPKPKVLHPVLKLLLLLMFSGFSVLLWVAAALCFIAYRPLGQPPDKNNLILGGFLVVIALYQGCFTFYQEYRSERVLASFQNIIAKNATVIRDGHESMIDATNLTVGDVVVLKSGEAVPADVRLVDVTNLTVDNSALTGESEPVHCTVECTQLNFLQATNMIWFGTSIVEGTAKGVVTAIGTKTVMSTVVQQASLKPPPTTIELEARKIVIWFGAFAILTGIALFVIWFVYVRVKYPAFVNLPGQITNCIGVVVAYVPEGLPVCVTISLAIVAKILVRKYQVLVTRLGTVETLGAVSLIASDKTGTLTTNCMAVRHVVVGEQLFDYTKQQQQQSTTAKSTSATTAATAASATASGTPSSVEFQQESTSAGFQAFLRAGVLCNSITTLDSGTTENGTPVPARRGVNPVDKALLTFASTFLPDLSMVRSSYPTVATIPFNSRNKWMATIHSLPSEGGTVPADLLLMKGAPEYMIQRCTTFLQPDGSEHPLTSQFKHEVSQRVDYLGGLGERCLGLCQRKLLHSEKPGSYNVTEINFPTVELCFVGLVAVMDPPRRSVPHALELCHHAGIKVVMVTGDHPATATAIAREVGIITVSQIDRVADFSQTGRDTGGSNNAISTIDAAIVVVGSDIPAFTEKHWEWVLAHGELVFARTSPEQKLLIVERCQKVGHVVAVTGDGVNDAPALKKADIGIAMGAGSEIAREAADMVLLENDFAAIVQGIKQGRCLYDNLRKVLVYVLPAGEFSELLPVIFNVLLGIPLPLSAFLMILICVGTDFFADLALVYEPPDLDLMDRRPRNRQTEALFTWRLLFTGFVMVGVVESFFAFLFYFMYMGDQGIPMSGVLFAFDQWGDGYYGFSSDQLYEFQYTAQSIYFVTLIVAQYGNLLMTRGRTMPLWESIRTRGVQLPLLNRLMGRSMVFFQAQAQPQAQAQHGRNATTSGRSSTIVENGSLDITVEGFAEVAREQREIGQDNTQNIIFAILGSFLLAIFVTTVPFMNSFFGTRPVPIRWWAQALGVSALIFVLGEGRKYYIRRFPHSVLAWLAW